MFAGERSVQRKDLGKAEEGVPWLKGWPSLLVLVKQELQGGSCPPMTLTVNRSRLAETLLSSLFQQLGAWLYKFHTNSSSPIVLNSHVPSTVFLVISLDIT